jgi:hypothetical protein
MRQAITSLLLAAVTVTPGIGSAQSHSFGRHGFTTYRGHNAAHSHSRPILKTNNAAKTTATDARLIAVTELEHDGTTFIPTDSTTLSFGASRGGVFDEVWLDWNWKPDLAFSYTYDNSTSAYDPANTKISLTFDAADNVTKQLIHEWNTTTSAWDSVSKSTNTYDASGKMLTSLEQEWNSTTSTWDNLYRTTYTYNTAGKLASSLDESWNNTSLIWENAQMIDYTWNASGDLTMSLNKYWFGLTWMDGFRSTYTYDASGNRIEQLNETSFGMGWDTTGKVVNSGFVANHQPQASIFMEYVDTTASFVNSFKDNYTYNTYGKPTYYYSQNWDTTSGTWVSDTFATATRYHYQTFTTGVAQVAAEGGDVRIFPVPATGNLSIAATWDNAQPFAVAITDMTGKIHTRWTVSSTKQYNETISVSDLPPGNYLLTLEGRQGRVTKLFQVVK